MSSRPAPRTEFSVKAPRFRLLPLTLDVYLTLPDGDQIGPTSLQGGICVTGLPAGDYQLTGQFEGFDPFSVPITLSAGQPVLFEPMKGASLAQRRRFRQAQGRDGKSTILYLQRRKRHVASFWVGHCESAERLAAFLSQGDGATFEDHDGKRQPAMNEFAASQSQDWYDRDLLEAGYETGGDDLATRFAAYSWASEWAPELGSRAERSGVDNPNCFIMIGGDPGGAQDWLLEGIADVTAPGINLHFAGEINFSYYDGGPAGR